MVGSALRQILVEFDLTGYLGGMLLRVVALSAKFQDVLVVDGALNVAYFDRQVHCVVLGLQRTEESVDVLSVVGSELSLRVLYLEDSKIIVPGIECLKLRQVNRVIQFGDA